MFKVPTIPCFNVATFHLTLPRALADLGIKRGGGDLTQLSKEEINPPPPMSMVKSHYDLRFFSRAFCVRHVLRTVTQPVESAARSGNLNSHFLVLSFCSFQK